MLLSLPKDWLLDLSEIDTLPVRYCLDVPVVDILVKTQINVYGVLLLWSPGDQLLYHRVRRLYRTRAPRMQRNVTKHRLKLLKIQNGLHCSFKMQR